MKKNWLVIIGGAALYAATAGAQQNGATRAGDSKGASASPAVAAERTDSASKPAAKEPVRTTPDIQIQHQRPIDQRGLNVFETPKHDTVQYTGFKLLWGAAFTQQFQGLKHENTASAKLVNGVDQNQLMRIGGGFNNAVANLYLNAQLAPGIRVQMTSYLSARHHQETWVKDGYLLIDESPIKVKPLENLMKYVTLRVGHFEVNYGDEHFRRTDNGNAMYNPLVGNFVMDAFTTEIGAEAYFRGGPWLAMAGATGGETRGQVTIPEKRSPAFLGKLGFDKSYSTNVRFRLTGSMFSQAKSANSSLYSGDRGGSRYYLVMVNTAGTEKDSAWTGNLQPGFTSEMRAYVLNPFIKLGGLEFFGNFEQAKGRARTEPENRTWNQNVYELTYRLLNDKVYVSGRYNTATGALKGIAGDVSVNRSQFGGGWFLTPNVMGKVEYVNQLYKNFPLTDIRNGGKFHGLMVEGVVAF
jgi:hypothetical protein